MSKKTDAFAKELDAITPALLDRAGMRCELRIPGACLEPTWQHNRHHRLPRSNPACSNLLSNLILACGWGNASGCHGYVETHREEAYEKGWLVRSGYDPEEVPWEAADACIPSPPPLQSATPPGRSPA